MQRKILALAVASAFAVPGAALAQVTISGAFRYSVDAVKWNDGTGATNVGSGVSKWGVTGHSANIKFASRENLGGGMTAWMALENGFAPGRANGANFGWFGRNSGLGIESTTWGTVMAGQWDSPYKSLDGAWSIGVPAAYSYSATAPIFGNGDTTGTMPNPNCANNISGAGFTATSTGTTTGVAGSTVTSVATFCAYSAGSGTSFQRRLANTVQWWSPVWSGVQLLVATETNDVKANDTKPVGGTINKNDPKLWAFGLRWTGPKWALVGGYEHHKNFNANAAGTNRLGKDTGWKIGGNYDFGPAQVSLAYERLNYELGTPTAPTDLRLRNWSIGLAVPIGNGAIRSQYSRSKASGTFAGSATVMPGTGAGNGRLFNLSYEYNMSKRTLLYVAYAKLNQDALSNRQFGTNLQGPNGATEANLIGSDPRYFSFGMNHNF
jgi:predicted porin